MHIKNSLKRWRFVGVVFILLLLIIANTNAQTDDTGGGTADPGEVPTVQTKKSDSPWLRLPEELRDVPPALPPDGPRGIPVVDPTAVEIFDFATGEVISIPSSDLSQQPLGTHEPFTQAFAGLLPFYIEGDDVVSNPRSVIDEDDRVRITGTSTFPWRTIAKLYITWPNSSSSGCSGSIIGSHSGHGFHVLTAGHCVHSQDDGGWASSILVVPGLDDEYMPYNYAWATFTRSYTGWTVNEDSRYDWAMLTLDRNIGDYVGWMGRITDGSGASMYTSIGNVAGYPGSTPSGDPCPTYGACMYYDSDSGHSADDDNHWYWMDTAGGMSGGPVWRYLSGDRHIMTIHTCGTGGCGIAGNGVNHGTRLNNDKYDRIFTWVNADTPPTDWADLLDDGQLYSGFSPTTVAGGDSFQAWSDVRNVGTAVSGGFNVAYYASTNTTITTSDYLIGTASASSISPFTWTNADLSNTFPGNIPNGVYYVGWIIDSSNAVSEFDEGNNTAYKSSYQLTVACLAPTAVTDLTVTPNGNNAILNWSSTGADKYEIHSPANDPYFNPSPASLITTITGTNHTFYGDIGNPATNWAYVIVAKDDCGATAVASNRVAEFDFSIVPGTTP